jgi:hypothetical protein
MTKTSQNHEELNDNLDPSLNRVLSTSEIMFCLSLVIDDMRNAGIKQLPDSIEDLTNIYTFISDSSTSVNTQEQDFLSNSILSVLITRSFDNITNHQSKMQILKALNEKMSSMKG